MLLLILYIVGIMVYLGSPFLLQVVFLVLNTFISDPIPYVDEIIMYGSVIKKVSGFSYLLQWIEENKRLAIAVGIVIIVLVIIIAF